MSAVLTGKFRKWRQAAIRKWCQTSMLLRQQNVVILHLEWKLPVIRRRREGAKLPILQNYKGRIWLHGLTHQLSCAHGPTNHPTTDTWLQLLRQHTKFLIQINNIEVLRLQRHYVLGAVVQLMCKCACLHHTQYLYHWCSMSPAWLLQARSDASHKHGLWHFKLSWQLHA